MLNFGIIGCGNISSKHIHIASNMLDNQINLRGLCDLDRSKFIKQKSNFNLEEVYFFEEYKDMINELKLDIVSILTPSGSHYKIANEIISETNCTVIIEKPICLRYEDAIAFNELTKKNKNKVYVLISDGEINEGTTWESLLFANHHKLDNLNIIALSFAII